MSATKIMTTYQRLFTITICFLLLVLAIPVGAEEKAIIGVSTIYESQKGKMVEVEVYIDSAEPIGGGSLELIYDPSLITISKETVGNALSAYPTSPNGSQPGKLSLSWSNDDGVAKAMDGTLLTFIAKLTNADETIPLTLKNVQLFSDNFSNVNTELLNGEIKPFPTNGEKKKHPDKVNNTKDWTIHFNTDIDRKSFNKHTVRVKDSRGNLINMNTEQIDKQTFKITPNQPYARGTYYLEVYEQIRSISGKTIKAPWQLEFTVQ